MSGMALTALQFPLYRPPYEFGAVFAVFKNGVDAVKRALREARRGLLVVDLGAPHRAFALGPRPDFSRKGLTMSLASHGDSLLWTNPEPLSPNPFFPQFPVGTSLCEKGNIARHLNGSGDLQLFETGDLHNQAPGGWIVRYSDLLGASWSPNYVQKRWFLRDFVHIIIDIRNLATRQNIFAFCGYHLLPSPGLMISSMHQQRETDMARAETWVVVKFSMGFTDGGEMIPDVVKGGFATAEAAQAWCDAKFGTGREDVGVMCDW